MTRIRKINRVLSVFTVATLFIAAQPHAEEVWEMELRAQLLAEKSCELTLISDLKIGGTEGQETLQGRAHCSNGKAFDFARNDPTAQFQFRSCEVREC